MSELPLPEIKDSDFGWECPWCRTKIGKDFRPLSNCACGQPWVVLDAEGKRTAETFSVPLPMVSGGKCPHCGMAGGFHLGGCDFWLKEPPPVYDLAEFERRLEEAYQTAEESDWVMETILKCLKASKRDAK